MLQYLIILLDDTSTSFCHYESARTEQRLVPLKTLRAGIRFGMMENLMIQYVYPDYELPAEYDELIESIDHSKIKPTRENADVWVTDDICDVKADVPVVWRTDKQGMFAHESDIIKTLTNVSRLNIVLTDIETFTDEYFDIYKALLSRLSAKVETMFVDGKSPQLNLLTDRMMITQMNNCGAGDTTITLAPNGKFYVCPAFYYADEKDCIGDLEHGLDIKNKQLYKLEYAPICRHCDAYHCKRCIWLNRKTTFEVNTPSHEQCVVAHLERNTSRDLLNHIRKHGTFLPDHEEIKEIDYLDPFNIVNRWK
ncbi:MAG: CXXX repeat peptide maturase [Bacteroidaceae bacterium]|nr:CXXX repeat peptide maturase [Bacteroidaceae bacterium]